MADTAFLVEPGWIQSVDVPNLAGPSIRALGYEDGTIRIEHKCRVIDNTQLIVAPALQLDAGHRVEQEDPLTVSPSILCPDCGLHGFIQHGRWVPA